MIGLGLSITQLAVRQMLGGSFNPLDLFANGESGAWYDPSDMSTLYQDAAGTTPVTAVEQPVGRILDKSGRGNHATQATATSRPVLSARVNLLTKTEQFDDAAWLKTNEATVTVNATTPPVGKLRADKLIPANATALACVRSSISLQSGVYANSVAVKNAGKNFVQILSGYGSSIVVYGNVDLTTLATSSLNITATDAGGGWVNVKLNAARAAGLSYLFICVVDSINAAQVAATVGNGVDGIFISGASLVPSNQSSLPYQRVNTETDYDTAGFPQYLKFDNIDDAQNTTFAASLGTNCTIARAVPGVSTSILTGQTVGTTFTNTTTHAGLLVIDRPLTIGETAQLTAFFNEKAGV